MRGGAASAGLAAGAGFALIENFYYLQFEIINNPGVWVVRGFGTAIMHGGVTAIFAILSQLLTEKSMKINPILFIPGLLAATALHSGFNHFFLSPILYTTLMWIFLPQTLYLVFEKISSSLHDYVMFDFDEDANVRAVLDDREFTSPNMRAFLTELPYS